MDTETTDLQSKTRKHKPPTCNWCGGPADRYCGICLACCSKRDERNRQIDAGLAAYVPPTERPGHRFYERRQITPDQRLNLAKARAARVSKSLSQMLSGSLS